MEIAREGGHRQDDGENRTAAFFAADQDLAAVFGHDTLGDTQSQTRAFAFGFGCEEGVEDRRQDMVGNPLAVVYDFYGDVVGFVVRQCDDLDFAALG